MNERSRPLLVFDGDCGFCRAWIARWHRTTGDRVDYAPFQEVAMEFPEIPRERFASAVQLIEPDGTHTQGAEAVFRSLAYAPGGGGWLELYRGLPGFARVSEWAYRRVAGHRPAFTRLTRWLWGEHVVPPGESLTAWIFLRLLGVVYAAAFASVGVQVLGLIGSRGILPAYGYLGLIHDHYGWVRYWLAPTVFWLGSGDHLLLAMCAGGVVLSVLLVLGVAPILSLVGLWIGYLSLVTVGQNFFWFQWDGLLLETGLVAIFLAPWRWWSRPGSDPAPARAPLWLLRWLLFRLMFASGLVKLTSGDLSWRHLTALTYHYETQPLPPWTAWYMHLLPRWFHQVSTGVVLAVELLAPLLIFLPRRARMLGAALLAGLQVLILVTGNYGFFNLLTLALCVLLLDDGAWPERWRPRPAATPPAGPRWPRRLLRPIAIALVVLSLVPLFRAAGWAPGWMRPVADAYRFVSPFRAVNSYGLFAVMTTQRPEIIVEGSDDGATWKPYEFRYKPGDVMHRPCRVAFLPSEAERPPTSCSAKELPA